MEKGYRCSVPNILVISFDQHIHLFMYREMRIVSVFITAFYGHQKNRGVIVQRKGVSMVLPCVMVPQIILYGIEERERVITVIRVLQLGEKTMTINGTEELR